MIFMPDMSKAKQSGRNIFDILEAKSEEQLSREQGGLLKKDLVG